MNHTMQIGKRTISAASPTFIVAEVSANHNQNYDRAVEIIHAAAEAGADVTVLEQMPVIGGNTNKATGGMNASETSVQEEL